VAGGVYMPGPEELRAIRTYLVEHHAEFRKLSKVRGLRTLMGEVRGEQLSRVPKGFCAEHPAANLVRSKQWLFDITLDGGLAAGPQLLPELVKRFRAMTPFVEFLNRPLVQARRPRPAGPAFGHLG
jgi:uncharacterized protein (DUF2461 family)